MSLKKKWGSKFTGLVLEAEKNKEMALMNLLYIQLINDIGTNFIFHLLLFH
jgi:hypothetical protein